MFNTEQHCPHCDNEMEMLFITRTWKEKEYEDFVGYECKKCGFKCDREGDEI